MIVIVVFMCNLKELDEGKMGFKTNVMSVSVLVIILVLSKKLRKIQDQL